QEGRLSRSIRTHQTNALANADLQIERLDDVAMRVGERGGVGIQHDGRAALGRERKVGRATIEIGYSGRLQLFAFLFELAPHVFSTRGELRVLARPLGELLGAGFEFLELAFLELAQLGGPLMTRLPLVPV